MQEDLCAQIAAHYSNLKAPGKRPNSPLPPALEGCTILDLGCGDGSTALKAAEFAGATGKIIGIDAFEVPSGANAENVTFTKGYLEDLTDIADASIDVVVSNPIVNLSPAKEQLFSEIWRVLKDGGELYMTGIFTDRRVEEEVSWDAALMGQQLAGALYIEDFRRMMARVGWAELRWLDMSEVAVESEQAREKTEGVQYVSATLRAIKLPDYLEDLCEKYGQYVTYNGGIEGMEDGFVLDDSHTYNTGERSSACGNPAATIEHSRYGKYFTVEGSRENHNGACCGGVISKHLKKDSGCCCGSSSSNDCCSSSDDSGSSCCGGSSSAESSSCCCGGDGAASDCCDSDVSADDPNTQRKQVVIVDYLYLDLSVCDRCQGTDERVAKAIETLRPTMDMAGYNLVMRKTFIENEELAQRFKFESSPTVRVNDVDICPKIIENECGCCRTLSDYDVNCRQFEFNGKLYEVPPTAYIVKRIQEIVFGHETPKDEPYQMPENIRGFLQKKYV